MLPDNLLLVCDTSWQYSIAVHQTSVYAYTNIQVLVCMYVHACTYTLKCRIHTDA